MKSKADKKSAEQSQSLDKLDTSLKQALDRYFRTLDEHQASGLHQLVSDRIEKILLEYILNRTNYHQSQTAKILGINRTTLRNKMARLKIDNKKPGLSGKKQTRRR